jgi:hypothetical protein
MKASKYRRYLAMARINEAIARDMQWFLDHPFAGIPYWQVTPDYIGTYLGIERSGIQWPDIRTEIDRFNVAPAVFDFVADFTRLAEIITGCDPGSTKAQITITNIDPP